VDEAEFNQWLALAMSPPGSLPYGSVTVVADDAAKNDAKASEDPAPTETYDEGGEASGADAAGGAGGGSGPAESVPNQTMAIPEGVHNWSEINDLWEQGTRMAEKYAEQYPSIHVLVTEKKIDNFASAKDEMEALGDLRARIFYILVNDIPKASVSARSAWHLLDVHQKTVLATSKYNTPFRTFAVQKKLEELAPQPGAIALNILPLLLRGPVGNLATFLSAVLSENSEEMIKRARRASSRPSLRGTTAGEDVSMEEAESYPIIVAAVASGKVKKLPKGTERRYAAYKAARSAAAKRRKAFKSNRTIGARIGARGVIREHREEYRENARNYILDKAKKRNASDFDKMQAKMLAEGGKGVNIHHGIIPVEGREQTMVVFCERTGIYKPFKDFSGARVLPNLQIRRRYLPELRKKGLDHLFPVHQPFNYRGHPMMNSEVIGIWEKKTIELTGATDARTQLARLEAMAQTPNGRARIFAASQEAKAEALKWLDTYVQRTGLVTLR
jgi:hypothetical protein